MERKKVILFKAEVDKGLLDPYVEVIKKAGIVVSAISPIEFKFINCDSLGSSLKNAEGFSGLIFTSPRSVRAVHQACKNYDIDITKWKELPCFCVGDSTSSLAESLLNLNPVGKEAGSSEQLCNFILQSNLKYTKPFLFPTGNLTKETVAKTLNENGFSVSSITCYETVCNSRLKCNWEELVSQQSLPKILVYFSPSGVEFTHEITKQSFGSEQPQCIAIGPTTEKALIKVGIEPCKVALKPNPEAVLSAIKSLVGD